jgi:hypothetical protein
MNKCTPSSADSGKQLYGEGNPIGSSGKECGSGNGSACAIGSGSSNASDSSAASSSDLVS